MISDDRSDIAFLRQCLRYDESAERMRLEEKIKQIQLDECCVLKGVSLMALLIVLAMAGLWCAEDISEENFRLVVKVFGALGLGALISLLGFVGLWFCYRQELCRRREECRRLVMKVLESRVTTQGTVPEISAEPITMERSEERRVGKE